MFRKKEAKEAINVKKELIKEKEKEITAAKKIIKRQKIHIRTTTFLGRLLEYFVFNRRGQPSKKDYKNPDPVEASIYPTKEPLGKYCKRFNWIHRFFKTIIFVPSLKILYKLMNKRLDKGVEDTWYNKNLVILDKSWKETMEVMSKYMCPKLPGAKSYEITRKMMFTLVLNDSITREFMNVLLHTITRRMQEAYKGKGEVYHVFYTDRVSYNPVYFSMVRATMEKNQHPADVQAQNLNKEERKLYEEEQKLRKRREEIIKQKHFLHMMKKAEDKAKQDMSKTAPPIVGKGIFEPIPENLNRAVGPDPFKQNKPPPTKEKQND